MNLRYYLFFQAIIMGMKRWSESKISLCFPSDMRASPQTFCERGGVI